MKKKFLTFLLAVCFILPCAVILTACGGKDPEITLSSISAEAIDPESTTIAYEPNISEKFELEDFKITATYSDGSTAEITEGVTMESSGIFNYLVNDGKFTFTYQEKTAEVSINVTQRSIESNDFVVTGVEDSYTLESSYDSIQPEITLTWNGITLEKNSDYEVSYGGNNKNTIGENAGSIIVSGYGNFTGTKTITFDILPMESNEDTISFSNQTFDYDGDEHYIALADGQYPDSVWTISYQYSTDDGVNWKDCYGRIPADAGTYKVKAIFNMNAGYEQIEPKIKTVVVNPMNITNAYINADYANATFANRNIVFDDILSLEIKSSEYGDNCVLGTDFIVDADYNENDFVNGYKNNFNATNSASVMLKGQGNFSGNREINFIINPLTISSTQLTFGNLQTEWTFNDTIIEPTFDLSYQGINLVKDTDYTITYQNNKFAGTGRIGVKFKGNYDGNVAKTFNINPYELDISCLAFEDTPLVYNSTEQKIEITLQSLGTLLANNPNFANLLYNTTDPSTIRYAISYSYSDTPTDAGTYTAIAKFGVVNAGADYAYYLESIKLMNDETPVADYDNAISKQFTIAPLEITSNNTTHQFKNEAYRTNNSATYNSETFDLTTQLVVDLGNGNSETLDVYQYPEKNAGTYTLEPKFNGSNDNYTFSKETCGLNNLTFIINKVDLTLTNIETYIEMPTITCIEGDGANKYQLSEFTSKLAQQNTSENAELYITNYNSQENKFEVELIADNYNLTEELWITPTVKNLIELGIIGSIKMGTTGSTETTDVTNTFFTSNLLEVGKYFEFYYTEEWLNSSNLYKCYPTGTFEEINNGAGYRVSVTEERQTITFKITNSNNAHIISVSYYVTAPEKLINDSYLNNVYVLTYNNSSIYTLYEVTSGEEYGVDYTLDDFKYGATNIINIIVDATENTVSYLCSKSLEEMGIELGSLDANDKNTLKNNTIDIANFKQDVVYLIYYSQTTDLGGQKSMLFNFVTTTGIETIFNNQHVDTDYEHTMNGEFVYVDKDYEENICIPTYSDMQVWSEEQQDFIDADIYISPKGKLVVSATELTEIDTDSDTESGINVFVLPVRYVKTYMGKTYYVENTITIYRESFSYKYYGADNDSNKFEHNESLYNLISDYSNFGLTINSYENDGDALKVNDYGILSLDVMKSETELATLAEIKALDLTTAISLLNTNSGITYKKATLEEYEVNGETRLYLVITYDYVVTYEGETGYEATGCERLIQLHYAEA